MNISTRRKVSSSAICSKILCIIPDNHNDTQWYMIDIVTALPIYLFLGYTKNTVFTNFENVTRKCDQIDTLFVDKMRRRRIMIMSVREQMAALYSEDETSRNNVTRILRYVLIKGEAQTTDERVVCAFLSKMRNTIFIENSIGNNETLPDKPSKL